MARRRMQRLIVGLIPAQARLWLRARQRQHRLQAVRAGTVDWGGLRRTSPISGVFGLDRGTPIDRYYIERFLAARAADIRGRVLEAGDDAYTLKFGGERVTRSDVLNLVAGQPKTTIQADLTRAGHLPPDTFDCIVLTQTLQMIFEVQAALGHLHRILKPGGVLLVTWSGISRIARREGVDDWGEYWHITSQAGRRLFTQVFPAGQVTVRTYGNVLAATAFLHGLAAEELELEELDRLDDNYELLVAIRAVK
jgi:SAM-dependent methyltransferase